MKKQIFLITLLFSLFQMPIWSQGGPLNLQIVQDTSQSGKLKAHFTFDQFDQITSFQFSVAYPSAQLEFDSLTSNTLEGFGNTNYTLDEQLSRVKLLWFDLNGLGVSLPDGTIGFTAHFSILNEGDYEIYATDCPLTIEVTQAALEVIPLVGDVQYECSSVTGYIRIDESDDCSSTIGNGLNGWSISFTNSNSYYTESLTGGFFKAQIPNGTYTVEAIPPNGLWSTCTAPFQITISTDESTNVEFLAKAEVDCPSTFVNVTTPFLRRCFPGFYVIEYGNQGTIVAEDAFIEFVLDADLEIVSSELPWTSQMDSLYIFDVGDLAPGASGSFRIDVQVGCEGVALGQAHCSSAHIYPDTICVNGAWDQAHIVGRATCLGDSVHLSFQNVGQGIMQNPMEIRVIEDDVIVFMNEFQLGPQMMFDKTFEADGSTFRMEGGQGTNFPFTDVVFTSIEGCDADGDGNFSLGYLTMFQTDPEEPFLSTSCVQNVGSFDPNDKNSSIQGVGPQRYIEANQNIDYLIRFQNTGTDTAFNIRILDTLPPTLDISDFEMLGASHKYRLEISEGGVLDFYFDDILLVDSFSNEPLSHGFIRYRIAQQPDLAAGTQIQNRAGIYFDFNEPVITNYAIHTIEEDFLDVTSAVPPISLGDQLEIYPNPVSDFAILTDARGLLTISDANQRILNVTQIKTDQHQIDVSSFQSGLYWLTLRTDQGKLKVGKLMIIK